MAAPALTFETLKKQISNGQLSPVYLLHGKEGYFTDALVKAFEQVIPEEDKEFNQYILYAPQVEPGQVMDLCRHYPMMSDRQIVILKEAQAVRADVINKLHKYVNNPSPTTVLVIVFRGEDAAGKDLIAAVKKKGVIFESKEIKQGYVGQYINSYVKQIGMRIDVKAVEMLKEFIGTSVSKIYNEIDKLHTILGDKATITPEAVERNVGISKDYNIFELVDALSVKNALKAMRITEYYAANPKANPTPKLIPSIFSFFSDLLVAIYTPDKTNDGLMKALGLKNEWQLRKFRDGMRFYNAFQLIEIIWAIRKFDAYSKGNGSRQDEYSLFRELIYHILTAPGNLGVSGLSI